MDIMNLSLAGLATLGFVNVVSFYKPDMDSKLKFGLSVIFAFAVTFVPAELGNVLLEKAKDAVTVALAMSGLYKVAQKAGGN